MGLNIREIIPRKELQVSELKGKIVCVDAFNILYQFLSTIRQPDGTPLMDNKKRITSHLSGIFYRNVNLLSEGIKLVYVFDGEAPGLKIKTYKKRKEARDIAKGRYESAKQEEDIEEMKRYSSQLIRLDDEMIEEAKQLLEAMVFRVVQPQGEGKPEVFYLARHKSEVYASVSQDYDSLLFGTPKLVRNLTISRRKKTYSGYIEINPEIIDLQDVFNKLEINLDQLICLGILVGTDYNPRGVPGIGQKKALEFVRKFKTPVRIFKEFEEKINNLPEEDKFDWQEIFELFHKPNARNVDFKFEEVDEKKIKEILVKEHNFSEERIENQLEKLREFKEKNKQKGLDKWF